MTAGKPMDLVEFKPFHHHVELAGRDALAEMRCLLAVFNTGQDPRALAPQPGLADVPKLVSRTRAAGLQTELLVVGQQRPLSPALDLCAYRIVQEALTNTIKHAGPASATVRMSWASAALELEVFDDGRRQRTPSAGPNGGHGIAGMRERVRIHGGRLHAGPRIGGGFAIHASLPLPTRNGAE